MAKKKVECMDIKGLWGFISDNRQAIYGSFRMASFHNKVCVVHAGEKHPLIQHINPEWLIKKTAVVYFDPSEFNDPLNFNEFNDYVEAKLKEFAPAVSEDTVKVD